ncbi:DUF5063 domain-containing protein [Phytoactinopolyspora mesophila]|uniref:DUF5063 domain-containing protein n=1 Tax=Phytoactinopolyspora mesophila TaxID=2650750 RepID=A0A7K3MCJ3_9ACTN|nr:DUF5063 domain-containing protein [Phytoactinopolyspora mesophila]NDL60986.1 DUF5063 domain-containing protein [Phytoactinopolyspora mesophila]
MSEETATMTKPGDEYSEFGAEIADQVESFLLALREIARGEDPASTLSLLLLEVSQLSLAGGRLGAISDVVPHGRFEPDTGPDADVDELRERLAKLLDPIDPYVEVIDPIDPERGVTGFRLSDDLASIAADLLHGLSHYRDGRTVEALWWWQFSYMSSWGSTCGAAMRALHSLIAHTRLDHERDDATGAEERSLLDQVDS